MSFSSTEQQSLSRPHRRGNNLEVYSDLETYMEIEVTNPRTNVPRDGTQRAYTDYEIICRTNLPNFPKRFSKVRRRYSDFEKLRKCLVKEASLSYRHRVLIPHLPGKTILTNKFSDAIIDERRAALNQWLQSVAGHPLLQSSFKTLARFIQDENFHF